MMECSSCLDDKEELVFRCASRACEYVLCASCVKLSFQDASGQNVRSCPFCRAPIARRMVESVCGPGVVREVKRELRSQVEFEVAKEAERERHGRKEMKDIKGKALKYCQMIAEELTASTKCPRCKAVFADYDGCNALHCHRAECGAAFCAICLKDCGRDAHQCAQSHGNLFDKDLFHNAKTQREKKIADAFLTEISGEPFELQELVRMGCEKLLSVEPATGGGRAAEVFLTKAIEELRVAVRRDRLSLLANEMDDGFDRLSRKDVSPRNVIPEDYELTLTPSKRNSETCRIELFRIDVDRGRRVPIPLPDKDQEESADRPGQEPVVDALFNLKQGLKCCVIALRGARRLYQTAVASPDGKSDSEDEVAILFHPVSTTGALEEGNRRTLYEMLGEESVVVLGFNQNLRLLMLEKHAESSTADDLLFSPLRHFVGDGAPGRIFDEISVPAPDTFRALNEQQRKVAHPLSLRTAMEVAGPPGTGKTKTITELVRAVLLCTQFNVLVLSERNGAIDAIAEKMASDCLRAKSAKKEVKDLRLWMSILAVGSSGIGESTKLFTKAEKLRFHPELLALKRIAETKDAECNRLAKKMRNRLAESIEALEERLPEDSDAWNRSLEIKSGTDPELKSPIDIINCLLRAERSLKVLLEVGPSYLGESDVEDAFVENSVVLGRLIPIRDAESKNNPPWQRHKKVVFRAVKVIYDALRLVKQDNLFSLETAEATLLAKREAEEALTAAKGRIDEEFSMKARVRLSTIGSWHKLFPSSSSEDEHSDVDDVTEELGKLSIAPFQPTVVVFDEAGCIPSFEFIGLSRLGVDIAGLICVGDKHQLPPYDAGPSFNRNQGRSPQRNQKQNVKSLLDVCALDREQKIALTTQYRVPRDIAGILNARVYRGQYNTDKDCNVPLNGFDFVDVENPPTRNNRKYVNMSEVLRAVDLVRELKAQRLDSIMVLTPYKKQQRELQFRLKNAGFEDVKVLSIDQCQGQEADYVILSLVQKPTRFLNINRLNVALSRVRKKLYFLANKRDFQEHTRDDWWECYLIGRDLLGLAHEDYDSDF